MKLDAQDSLRLGRGHGYEQAETRLIKERLKPGGFFIDIGAHIGHHTLTAAEAVGPAGRVYAVEPEPRNFEILLENTSPHQAVKCFRFAITNTDGMGHIFLSETNSGDHRAYPTPGRRTALAYMTTLDDLVGPDGKPDLLKIDTQGLEWAVLEGGKKTIERARELEMIVEFYPAGLEASGASRKIFFDLLYSFNFGLYNIAKGTTMTTLEETTPKALEARIPKGSPRHLNLFCRRPG